MGQILPYAGERLTALVMSKRSMQRKTDRYPLCGLGLCGYIVAMQSALQMLGTLPDQLPSCLRPQFS